MKNILLPNGMKLAWDYFGGGYWDIKNDYFYFQDGEFVFITHTIVFSTKLF